MMVPDYGLIGEISLYSMGFIDSRRYCLKDSTENIFCEYIFHIAWPLITTLLTVWPRRSLPPTVCALSSCPPNTTMTTVCELWSLCWLQQGIWNWTTLKRTRVCSYLEHLWMSTWPSFCHRMFHSFRWYIYIGQLLYRWLHLNNPPEASYLSSGY